MIYRVTTSGTLKNYRFNLNRSSHNRNEAQNAVLTGRKFNSYKEDSAAAARSFQLRSTLSRTSSQLSVSESVTAKYEVAWSTLDSVKADVNKAQTAIMRAANDPTGTGRTALGMELEGIAKSIVQHMNAKFGDNYVYAGADGLNVPFSLADDGTLTYRGVDVTNGAAETLEYLANGESKYVDLGMGLEEENGQLIQSSAFDCSLSGLKFLGYGVDNTTGESNNIVTVIYEMSQLLKNCDKDTGNFKTPEDQEKFDRLFDKFDNASDALTNQYTALDTEASFLKSNHKLLEGRNYTLQEQVIGIEEVDPAEAITAYSWAQYCYNSALKVGNSILSESLMDYMNT